jgi:gamma-glutamyltranspeptidase/glutathione hydrolase
MQAMNARSARQLAGAALGLMFLLGACGESEVVDQREIGNPAGLAPGRGGLSTVLRGNFAAAVADESRAAEVGRDTLIAGGNAVDAAVAMYFAQAVTLPSASSLGAAGICLVHSYAKRTAEMFAFPPMPAPGPIQGAAFTVPLGVRAITLMHVRHGKLRFEQLVSPAERLARFGTPASRALARDVRAGAGALGGDAEARRIFGRGGALTVVEGDTLVQPDLASVLGSLRQTGGVDFFQGRVARLLADQIAQMGGSLPVEIMRSTVPISGPPLSEAYGGFQVNVAPPPFAGAAALAAWNGQPEPASRTGDSNGVASFVAVDATGTAAVCSLSMGQLFGIRRIVPGTGILLGAATADAAAISPMLIGSSNNGEFLFAGGAGGSDATAPAVGAVARATIQGKAAVVPALGARGGRGGYVNALACPRGLRGGVDSCSGGSDPAGLGLALPALTRR